MENIYKNDAQLLQKLLEANGYKVFSADGWTPYITISDGKTRIWADLAPDEDGEQTNALFFSANERKDGYFVSWYTGAPSDEQYYILEAVQAAIAEQREYLSALEAESENCTECIEIAS